MVLYKGIEKEANHAFINRDRYRAVRCRVPRNSEFWRSARKREGEEVHIQNLQDHRGILCLKCCPSLCTYGRDMNKTVDAVVKSGSETPVELRYRGCRQ